MLDLLIHSTAIVSCFPFYYFYTKRLNYTKCANYGLKKIANGTEILLCTNYKIYFPKFLIALPPLIIFPFNGEKYKECSFLCIKKDEEFIGFNVLSCNIKFVNYSSEKSLENFTLNGEIAFDKFCKDNHLDERKLIANFPVLVHKFFPSKEVYTNITKTYDDVDVIEIYDSKEQYDQQYIKSFILPLLILQILHLIYCVQMYI